MPSAWGAGVSGFITWNPHSTWIATAIELGIPGLFLLGASMLGGAWTGWRRGLDGDASLGLGPAWIAMLIFSLTHAVLLEPETAVLVTLMVAVAIRPPPAAATMTASGD